MIVISLLRKSIFRANTLRIFKVNSDVVACYPSPLTDHLNIATNIVKTTRADLELCTVSGVRVKSCHLVIASGNAVSSIENLSSLPPGFYMVKISTKDKNYYQQVIKQ